jgi:hypothetical protein
MSVLEPAEIAMLPSEPDADKPLPIPKASLLPMVAVPVFINRSPDMPTFPALLVDATTLPELVAVPTLDEMVAEPPKAVLPLPPLIVTDPPLVLPSPMARVKLLPLLVPDNPELIDASPPAAPDKLPSITLKAPPMSVPEPTEIAMLPPKPDADETLPKCPRHHCRLPSQFQFSMIAHPICQLFLCYYLILPLYPSLWPCQRLMKW